MKHLNQANAGGSHRVSGGWFCRCSSTWGAAVTHFNTSTPHPCGSVPGPAPGGGAAGAKGEKRPPRKAGERKSGKARLGRAGAAVFVSVRGRCLRLRPWRARSGPRRVRVGRERAGCGGEGPGGAACWDGAGAGAGGECLPGPGQCPELPPGGSAARSAQGDPDLCLCPSCLRSVLPEEEEGDGANPSGLPALPRDGEREGPEGSRSQGSKTSLPADAAGLRETPLVCHSVVSKCLPLWSRPVEAETHPGKDAVRFQCNLVNS